MRSRAMALCRSARALPELLPPLLTSESGEPDLGCHSPEPAPCHPRGPFRAKNSTMDIY